MHDGPRLISSIVKVLLYIVKWCLLFITENCIIKYELFHSYEERMWLFFYYDMINIESLL